MVGKREDTRSMGCHVEHPVCSICGQSPSACEHPGALGIGLRGFEVDHVSVVQAPVCTRCGTRMKGCSAILWACTNEGCEGHLRPVAVEGVHPIMRVEEQDDG
jgi:hypothetical protein